MPTITLEPALLQEEVISELEQLDALVLSDLLALYIREAAMHLDALSDAFDRGDAATIATVAHTVKGSSSTLGAALVATSALALETDAEAADLSRVAELIDALRHALDATDLAFRARSAGMR